MNIEEAKQPTKPLSKWIDLVNNYFPELSYDEAHKLLWSKTSFPFVSFNEVARQLGDYEFEVLHGMDKEEESF